MLACAPASPIFMPLGMSSKRLILPLDVYVLSVNGIPLFSKLAPPLIACSICLIPVAHFVPAHFIMPPSCTVLISPRPDSPKCPYGPNELKRAPVSGHHR